MTEDRVDLEDTILSVGDRVRVIDRVGTTPLTVGTVTRLSPTSGEVDVRVPGARADSTFTYDAADLVKVTRLS